jgi:Rhodopirellula transposase DDE domain
VTTNPGWVTVGTDHDTAEFAVETVRHGWQPMGVMTYPGATELLIIADGGGSNGSRPRLWKTQLQQLADETQWRISVCHLPPGTRKWNKIEHRMFAYITQNWRGRPLTSHEVIVNLIGNTTTQTGLHIHAELDTNH